MVGLGGSVDRARALAVGLNCYLVIFCMYVFRGFRPHLLRVLGGNIPLGSARMLATNLWCVLCVLWLVCVCSRILISSWAGRCSRWPWMGVRGFFPVCVGWCGRGLLCIGFALCILVLVLFGGWWQRSFFPISLGNTSICCQFYSSYCNFKFVILFI